MAKYRRCKDCPTIIPKNRDGRCPDCARAYERTRGTRQQRGYDAEHVRLRRETDKLVQRNGYTCWRCGNNFPPGSPFDLGHNDDRTGYQGPECIPCNRSTAGR